MRAARVRRSLALAVAAALGLAAALRAAGPPEARVWLEVLPAARPGYVPSGLPVRFALFEDGRVFVGGSAQLASGKLTRAEHKALDKRLALVRRLPGVGAQVALGPGATRYVLRQPREDFELTAQGDPAQAPPELRPLAQLLADLESFDHPSLAPFEPDHLLARASADKLPGGCREWRSEPSLEQLAVAPAVLPRESVVGWPTGAVAASACQRGRHFTLTLRPLLPGEWR